MSFSVEVDGGCGRVAILGCWVRDGRVEEYIACVSGGLEFIGTGDGISLHYSVFSSRRCRSDALLEPFVHWGYRYLVF